jgi:MIP family channel proteins
MFSTVLTPPREEAKSGEHNKDTRKSPDEQKREDEAREREAERHPASWLRWLLAELVGTFALTMVAAGGEVIGAVSHGEVGHAAKVVAPGLLVMALIYAMGDASGAHFNPAVTFAFTARGCFPIKRVLPYWAMQFAGAMLAALLLKSLFGGVAHLGAPQAHHGLVASFVMETLLTVFLITVIIGTATRYSVVGPNAALAVGATIALCGLFASPISGASMNPARSLGPMIASGDMSHALLYLAAPLLGALIALLLMAVLHAKRDPKEGEAAEGNQKSGK